MQMSADFTVFKAVLSYPSRHNEELTISKEYTLRGKGSDRKQAKTYPFQKREKSTS